MTRRILPILLIGISATVCRADGPGPSFDCRKAQTPDEIAICSDARLSELDRVYARDFKILRQKDRKQAAEQGRDFMKFRRLCGNDRYCILERLQYMPGGSKTPVWLTDAFKAQYAKEVANDDLRPRAYAAIGVIGSFTTSNKGIQATVESIDGPDTARASATAVFTEADVVEYCERDPGGETVANGGKLSVRGCVAQELRTLRQRRIVGRANCVTRILTFDGQPWTAIGYGEYGITWKNPSGEEMPLSGITAGPEGQMQLLCPNLYARLRAHPMPNAEASPGETTAPSARQPSDGASNKAPAPAASSATDADGPATAVREILSRDLSPVLNSNDKEGDDRKFMTADLYQRFEKGARDFDADPYIGGQDNTGFKVDDVTSVPLDASHAVVTVAFSIEHSATRRKLAYHMVADNGRWLVDDIDYLDDKTSMRRILDKASTK